MVITERRRSGSNEFDVKEFQGKWIHIRRSRRVEAETWKSAWRKYLMSVEVFEGSQDHSFTRITEGMWRGSLNDRDKDGQ